MFNPSLKNNLLWLVSLLLISFTCLAQDIVLWHSLDGPLAEKFSELVQKFNQKALQAKSTAKIVLRYKGEYENTLASGLKVINTADAPHILQVYEVGNLMMQAHPGAYVSLDNLPNKPSPNLEKDHFITAIGDFYQSRQHNVTGLPSLPFSAASIVLFYNKNAFKAAGLDPEKPPTSWEEFEKIAYILKKHGAKNVLASGWLVGHHIEHLGAWHNQAIATKGNGIDGDDARLVINSDFFINHLNKLANWYQMGIFSLDFRHKAEQAFANNEVVILTQGANRLSHLERQIKGKFEIGVGAFPYWEAVVSEPYNTAPGGASFWALAGHNPKDYPIIQKFFEYLASPEVQNEWHQNTCYMPVVKGVEILAEKQNFYEKGLIGKTARIALDSFSRRAPSQYSRGILLPDYSNIREIIVQEMKAAIRGNKSAAEALERSVVLGNAIIEGKQVEASSP